MSNESENKRIDLTQFEMLENGEYRIEGCIADTTRYMYEDESDIRLSKQMNLLPDLITELKKCYEEIDALKGQPKTKKTRYGKPWHYECPSCGASDDAVPQLNFKNRCCFLCGWNDFGQDPEVMIRCYNAKNASK